MLPPVLRGLDEADWAAVSHAYGPAVDTPDLLRQAASPDREVASNAVSELYGSVFHQGTVYPATVVAVDFLAELATGAPHGRADIVWLLGQLADPEHAYGESFPAVLAAVATRWPALAGLLADRDDDVREAAAYAAAQAGSDAEPLWERWRTEAAEPVRASLVLALGLVDSKAAAPVLAEAAVTAAPPVRVAAAAALLRAGLPWPTDLISALVTAIDQGGEIAYCWAHGSDWFDELVVSPPADVALPLLRGLLQASKPSTRELGLWAAAQRCDGSRSAPAQVVTLAATALHDADAGVRGYAVDTLTRAGAAAGAYADALADIAAGYASVAGSPSITPESKAVAALAQLGDPRWIDPVCAAASAGHRPTRLLANARRRPAVLAAVRERLAKEPARADVLAGVLGAWRAREATPDLVAALPYAGPQVTRALLEIGHDDPALRPHLAHLDDLAAAQAIRRIDGDAQPLLNLLTAVLTGQRRLPAEARVDVDGLGPALLPAAREHLTGEAAPTYPQRETQILAARVAAAADDLALAHPTIRAVLVAGHTPARAAADLVAELALTHREAVADLEPQLRDRLDDRWSRVAAARALARLGTPVADLTEPLVNGVSDYAGRFGLDVILELRAIDTIPHLESLAAADRRLPIASIADNIVWADEQLVDRIHETIAALRAEG
jgi:hypothetical protein